MKTVDVFLDKDGDVVPPEQAATMRRTVMDDEDRIIETSVWFATGPEKHARPGPRGNNTIVIGNPYRIDRAGMQFQVVKAKDGHVMGTHATLAKAKRQLRALHAAMAGERHQGDLFE